MAEDTVSFAARLKALLPARWFGDSTPVLDAITSAVAAGWDFVHAALGYARRQTRVATMTDSWLDLAAEDYFGRKLRRRPGQSDAAFRRSILQALIRERGTRAALRATLIELTGRTPIIFEPYFAYDTGAYGGAGTSVGGGLAYGAAGGWGSSSLPFQVFVAAYRPTGNGIASLPGWGASISGYAAPCMAYANLSMIEAAVADDDVRRAVLGVLPASTVAWLRLQS